MNSFIKKYFLYSCLIFVIISCEQPQQKPNVLFISIDDLRTELGAYGNTVIQTPNIDKLVSNGVAFTNHFVQVPTCGASRHSLLTGMRPQTRAHLGNNVIAKEIATQPEKEGPESFIHQLKRKGYHTVGIGKISHSADGLVYGYEEEPSNQRELPRYHVRPWLLPWLLLFTRANGFFQFYGILFLAFGMLLLVAGTVTVSPLP